ncbi:MAG: glycoside hydrolase [Verrucomicrobia bacterium]|nr:glycoside hydrolase [Verrucomicrobiota bacterium]
MTPIEPDTYNVQLVHNRFADQSAAGLFAAASTRFAGFAPLRLFAWLVVIGMLVAPCPSATAAPPGVVVDSSPKSSGLYIGSPSLTVLPNGDYLASHDFFGPKSDEHECPTVAVFRSSDRGASWKEVTRLRCLFWANLFTHRGAAYIMGTDKQYGRIVIRRSTNEGQTWTEPRDAATGLLTTRAEYHTAPMPVVEHNGRLWRAFEDASGGNKWGERYGAGMLSIPVEADLLNATNWTFSNFLFRDAAWLGGDFRAWLEGNAVVTREGRIVNILRVDTPGCPEKAAIVNVSADGKTSSFDPATGFMDFPGGAKKFTIRFDPRSDLYWSLATLVPEKHQDAGRPGGIRNTLALVASRDLRQWTTRCILLYHPDVAKHGFQYPDWHFDGDDLIAVVRTAFDDNEGGARNNHDANFMTFHRWKQFRALTMADSVPVTGSAGMEGGQGSLVGLSRGVEEPSVTLGRASEAGPGKRRASLHAAR